MRRVLCRGLGGGEHRGGPATVAQAARHLGVPGGSVGSWAFLAPHSFEVGESAEVSENEPKTSYPDRHGGGVCRRPVPCVPTSPDVGTARWRGRRRDAKHSSAALHLSSAAIGCSSEGARGRPPLRRTLPRCSGSKERPAKGVHWPFPRRDSFQPYRSGCREGQNLAR
jgi:hypothetical protein